MSYIYKCYALHIYGIFYHIKESLLKNVLGSVVIGGGNESFKKGPLEKPGFSRVFSRLWGSFINCQLLVYMRVTSGNVQNFTGINL